MDSEGVRVWGRVEGEGGVVMRESASMQETSSAFLCPHDAMNITHWGPLVISSELAG